MDIVVLLCYIVTGLIRSTFWQNESLLHQLERTMVRQPTYFKLSRPWQGFREKSGLVMDGNLIRNTNKISNMTGLPLPISWEEFPVWGRRDIED